MVRWNKTGSAKTRFVAKPEISTNYHCVGCEATYECEHCASDKAIRDWFQGVRMMEI